MLTAFCVKLRANERSSETLPAEKIIAFYNETLNGFWAGERVVRVQPASEIHFAEQ